MKTNEKEMFPFIPSVNFHLWEPCNMRCKFCFATFQDVKKQLLPKGHLPKEQAIKLIHKIADFGFKKITFVGGEPTLCPWLTELISLAKKRGLTTMIVTNGAQLNTKFLELNKDKLDWVTLSIDSLNEDINKASGRAVRGKKAISKERYYSLVNEIKRFDYKLKINTVVTILNKDEQLTTFINYAMPDRWKIFQVLPIKGENDEYIADFEIKLSDFNRFIEIQKDVSAKVPIVAEANFNMKESYVMIDPAGRFFTNKSGELRYSSPILQVGINEAYNEMEYNYSKFVERGGFYNF